VLAHDYFLVRTDIRLPLGRDRVKTTPAGISLHRDYRQPIPDILPDPAVGYQQARLNFL
jgi:hypothetical protein